jgi:hypothetical protein
MSYYPYWAFLECELDFASLSCVSRSFHQLSGSNNFWEPLLLKRINQRDTITKGEGPQVKPGSRLEEVKDTSYSRVIRQSQIPPFPSLGTGALEEGATVQCPDFQHPPSSGLPSSPPVPPAINSKDDARGSFIHLDQSQRDQCNGLSWTASKIFRSQIKRSLELIEKTPWLMMSEVEIEMKRCMGVILLWLSRVALAARNLSDQLQAAFKTDSASRSRLCADAHTNFRCIEHAVHEARKLLKAARSLYYERSQTLLSVNPILNNILHHLDLTARKLSCLCRDNSPRLRLILSQTSTMGASNNWRVTVVA